MKVLVVYPNGELGVEHIKERPTTLEEFQSIVGGYIEPIYGDGWMAYVNEDGIMLRLPLNVIATALAKGHGWDAIMYGYLFGNVIFMGPDETDVPDWLVMSAKKFL